MNFEFLIEDLSGQKMLESIVPRIIKSCDHSFRFHSYRGLGRIPGGLRTKQDASKRILLEQLPRLLRGYGQTFSYDQSANVVIVVCDLDKKDKSEFLCELNNVLNNCDPAPQTEFCLAIEEIEAWLLGDINAIKKAFPKADNNILKRYENDSICDTWELLADAIYNGGSNALKKQGHVEIGKQKSIWAESIGPLLDLFHNLSPSFNYFLGIMGKYTSMDYHQMTM